MTLIKFRSDSTSFIILLYKHISKMTKQCKISYLAKDYIRDKASLIEYQCTICYEIVPDIIRCKGSCHNIMCLKCVSRSGYQSKPCPHRCSQTLQIENIPNLKMIFDCPFNKEKCQTRLQSEDGFNKHLNICEYKTQNYEKEQLLKANYRCHKGHQLIFINNQNIPLIFQNQVIQNNYSFMMNQECLICSQISLCRSYCLECKEQNKKAFFCTKCRFPPCTSKACPQGHILQIYQNFSYMCVCDCCGMSALMYGNRAYNDKQCNFVLCHKCYFKIQHKQRISIQQKQPKKPSFKRSSKSF